MKDVTLTTTQAIDLRWMINKEIREIERTFIGQRNRTARDFWQRRTKELQSLSQQLEEVIKP